MASGAGERSLEDDYESLLSTTDAELLKQAWRNEKASPEILKFEAALIHRSRQQIQLMVIDVISHFLINASLGFVLFLFFFPNYSAN